MKRTIFSFGEPLTENITLKSGIYLFEAWGATGGGKEGGKGAFVCGTLILQKEQTFQVNIGGKGESPSEKGPVNIPGGFNGGGDGGKEDDWL